jgi:hypothetical protein
VAITLPPANDSGPDLRLLSLIDDLAELAAELYFQGKLTDESAADSTSETQKSPEYSDHASVK